jgi:hypothetical protein
MAGQPLHGTHQVSGGRPKRCVLINSASRAGNRCDQPATSETDRISDWILDRLCNGQLRPKIYPNREYRGKMGIKRKRYGRNHRFTLERKPSRQALELLTPPRRKPASARDYSISAARRNGAIHPEARPGRYQMPRNPEETLMSAIATAIALDKWVEKVGITGVTAWRWRKGGDHSNNKHRGASICATGRPC